MPGPQRGARTGGSEPTGGQRASVVTAETAAAVAVTGRRPRRARISNGS